MNDTNASSGIPPLWLLVTALLALIGKQAFGVSSPLLSLFLAVAFFTVAAKAFFR